MGPELVDDLRKMRIAICQRECHVVVEEECRLEYIGKAAFGRRFHKDECCGNLATVYFLRLPPNVNLQVRVSSSLNPSQIRVHINETYSRFLFSLTNLCVRI